MAKKDNKGDPIEFRVSSGSGGRENIPIPVNRPNWIYRTYNSNSKQKPTVYEWIIVIGLSVIIIVVIAVMRSIGNSTLDNGVFTIFLGFIPVLLITWIVSKALYHPEESENYESNKLSKKRKKKKPKHRKDYE